MKKQLFIITIFVAIIFNFSVYAGVESGNIDLKSEEGVSINFGYKTSEFTPYDWKWSALKMVLSYKITLNHNSLSADDAVRVVLINNCKNRNGSMPACRDSVVEIDLKWDDISSTFVYDHPYSVYTDDDALWLKVCCYWEAEYDLELAVVINGEWLTDPINKSSNFLLIIE